MRKAQVSISVDVALIDQFDEFVGRGNRSRLLSEWMVAHIEGRLEISDPETKQMEELLS